MATELAPPPGLSRPPVEAGAGARRSRPVVWWAVLGVVCLGIGVYSQGGWLLSGDAHRIHPGVTPVPEYMRISAWVNQGIYALLLPALLAIWVVRPKLRTGRLSLEGLLFLAMFAVWWMDPAFNYLATSANYNSVMFNLGSWTGHIPGALAANARQVPEPLPWSMGFYAALVPFMMLGCCALMRRWRARWPRLSDAQLLIGAGAVVALGDLIFEGTWTHLGLYTYAGVVPGLALWEGHHYQFPLYEPVLVGLSGIAFVSFWWFRNDKGETLAERGLDGMRVGARTKTWLRFLALAGAMGTVYMSYNFAIQMVQLHAGPWPADVQKRSYFTNGLCGAGTSYSCPGRNVAVPLRGRSVHVGPDGKLVVPRGTTPPKLVPLSTR